MHTAIQEHRTNTSLSSRKQDHSDFGSRVFQRVITTIRYLNTVVYGTPAQATSITRLIHKYHSRVKGSGDDLGPAYYADDPELHRWTAATLYVAFAQVYELIFRPQSKEWHMQLMKECSVFATSLRMPTSMWFDNLEDFWAYWDGNIRTLEVTFSPFIMLENNRSTPWKVLTIIP